MPKSAATVAIDRPCKKIAFLDTMRGVKRENLGATSSACVVGIIPGQGSGPELVAAACQVLEAVARACGCDLEVRTSGDSYLLKATRNRTDLSQALVDFCQDVFSTGGAIVAGAVGGRFVYEMRRRFHLHYKLNPLRSYAELARVCRVKLPAEPIDILVVRENLDGIYQGESVERSSAHGREITHSFVHGEQNVRAVIEVAAKAASARRGALAVVGKESGLPAIHALWRRCALEASEAFAIEITLLDIDYAAYRLLQEPESFDVIVAPNCFGDILSDLGGVLAGSRGLTFGGSFSLDGAAVYQTNHGAAHDLAKTNSANPVGQIFSVAMMLRGTFDLPNEAERIEEAVASVWRAGWRTADLREPGCRIVGTKEFAELVTDQIEHVSSHAREACSAVQ